MDFKTIKSIDDPLFKAALKLYDGQFDIDLSEDEQIFKQSLQMKQSPSGLLIISVNSRAGRPQNEQIVSISFILSFTCKIQTK